ncbi:MAG: TlpA disulfide reductase family protein [Acidibacillus sp.]|uniref:Thiol-disulfide oxidoreductase YkuV n=1 Tax=Sulfoacidibacillus ferrooxidans TaxID=2005001 RepID=A0A9X1VB71_9BACL|nr:TlpA disulfide reductase family protein [Sulfoacidibacillus ferrooxidans]MCI0182782.1 Thiol-disulfide oxidoreductase YkuV [Sulfoacidibacillus ferrooxidans]MCY0893318.1 TlpA disulfide reductase family protein [Acidibacillus sp.]
MPMRVGTSFPGLEGATQWIGVETAPQLSIGQPILIHFWAVSCHICHETMSEVIRYRDMYVPQGLQLISVHMPRYEADTELQKVFEDIQTYGMTQTIAVDNMHKVAELYQNEFVPAYFLFDREGNLKFRAAGDKGLQNVGKKLEELFA